MSFRRRNPRDVPFSICANPRRSGRFTRSELKALRRRQSRSWEDPVGAYSAADDIALDRLMHRSRKAKRNCNPRGRSRRVRVSRSSKKWWHGLGSKGRKRVASLALGKLNPKRKGSYRPVHTGRKATRSMWRDEDSSRRGKASGRSHRKRFLRRAERRGGSKLAENPRRRVKKCRVRGSSKWSASERKYRWFKAVHRSINPKRRRNPMPRNHRRKTKQWPGALMQRQMDKGTRAQIRARRASARGHGRRAKAHSRQTKKWGWRLLKGTDHEVSRSRMGIGLNPRRRGRNPKLDGSPTRGEKRRVKYVEYLRSIAAKGEEARGHIATLTGELTKPGVEIHKPIGKRAVARAVKGHTAEWEEKHAAELAPAAEAAPVVVERPEVLNIKSRLHDLDVLHESYLKEIKQLGDSDQNEAEIEYLHGQIADLARDKKRLRDSLAATETAGAQVNPRRRGSRRRGRRANAGRIRRASAKLQRCILSMRKLLQQARTYLRSRR
jgi:hypothetical protein